MAKQILILLALALICGCTGPSVTLPNYYAGQPLDTEAKQVFSREYLHELRKHLQGLPRTRVLELCGKPAWTFENGRILIFTLASENGRVRNIGKMNVSNQVSNYFETYRTKVYQYNIVLVFNEQDLVEKWSVKKMYQ